MGFLWPRSISGALYHRVTTCQDSGRKLEFDSTCGKKCLAVWLLLKFKLSSSSYRSYCMRSQSAVLVGVRPQRNLVNLVEATKQCIFTLCRMIACKLVKFFQIPLLAFLLVDNLCSQCKLSALHLRDEQGQNQLVWGASQLNQPAHSVAYRLACELSENPCYLMWLMFVGAMQGQKLSICL